MTGVLGAGSCKWCENERLVKYSELKRQPWVFLKNKKINKTSSPPLPYKNENNENNIGNWQEVC